MKYLIKNILFTQEILETSEMVVNSNELTIVTGESGSGKSTLFNALTLENDFLDSIESNNKTLDKKSFINEHVSSCSQTPLLLDDYNIETHIELYKKMYEVVDDEHLIEELGLKEYLKSYPRQLSGGERMRVGILLTLLRDTDMYIFDEPTSSLDTELSKKVIRMIEEKKEEGKYILVFTHDPLFIEKADHHYAIENKKLIELKRLDKSSNTELTDNRKEKEDISSILFKKKRHPISLRLLALLLSLAIGFLGFSLNFNNYVEDKQGEYLEQFKSTQLLVGKSFVEGDNYLVGMGDCKALTDDEIKEIENLDHVESVDWRYDFTYPPSSRQDVTKTTDDYETEKATITFSDKTKKEYKELNFHAYSYLKDSKVKSQIKEDYGVEGIYITPSFLESHPELNKDLNGASMTFFLPVPSYNCYGRFMGSYYESDLFYINCDVVELVEVTIPIAGILKEDYFGITPENTIIIYYERGYVEKYLDQYRGKEKRTVYAIDQDWTEVYVNDGPKDKIENANRTMEESPWRPTSFTVTIDSLENADYVVNKLKKLDYSVESQYFQGDVFFDAMYIGKTGFIIVSIIAICIVLLAQILLKYFRHKDEEENMVRFLHHHGYDDKGISLIYRKLNLSTTVIRTVLSLVFYFIIIQVLNQIVTGRTVVSLIPIIAIILISLFVEFIIPMFFTKRLQNKSI